MRKAIGYTLFTLVLIVSWGIRLGLPIFGIYYIVKTFIDDGVIAGLISIPVTMIIIAIIEFVLDFVMFPFTFLVYFLLDEERPAKPDRGWFQRHLNWTVAMIWVLLLPLAVIIADVLGISVDVVSLVVPFLIILPLTGWALKQKNRSLWWLLLFIIPFMWLVYLGLKNKKLRPQEVETEKAVYAPSNEFQREMAHIRHQLKKAYIEQGMTPEEADEKIAEDELEIYGDSENDF